MNTREFIKDTEDEIQLEEIRDICENDPEKKAEIREKLTAKRKLLKKLYGLFRHNTDAFIECR